MQVIQPHLQKTDGPICRFSFSNLTVVCWSFNSNSICALPRYRKNNAGNAISFSKMTSLRRFRGHFNHARMRVTNQNSSLSTSSDTHSGWITAKPDIMHLQLFRLDGWDRDPRGKHPSMGTPDPIPLFHVWKLRRGLPALCVALRHAR